MTNYSDLKTARSLVEFVMANGLQMDVDSLSIARDIISNASVGELDDLANNADPSIKQTAANGRRIETRSTFYKILFAVWDWSDAVEFWNIHTNPNYTEVLARRTENKQQTDEITKLRARRDELLREINQSAITVRELMDKAHYWQQKAEASENEILKLKAKLYDFLVEKEEKDDEQ